MLHFFYLLNILNFFQLFLCTYLSPNKKDIQIRATLGRNVTLDFLCGRDQRMIIDITDLDELSRNKIMSIVNSKDKERKL